MTVAVSVSDLTKRYGSLVAVDHITFEVASGEIFGILGPNGAGKTTTLEIMEGLRRPDAGRVLIDGIDVLTSPREVRSRIGVQLQEAGFFERLSPDETLRLFASYHRRSLPAHLLLERLGLAEKRHARVETLSGGQRQRLSIALALLNDPSIVFLDEPTTGLDPQARRAMWEIIEGIRRDGRTVILTTHYMEEAQRLCDRLAIMDHGRIVAQDSPRALIRAHAREATVVLVLEDGHLDAARLPGVSRVDAQDGEMILHTGNPQQTLHALLDLNRLGVVRYRSLRVEEPTLEDVFLHLTGRRLRE
ncbi:MAG: ABC transporter ATP-binding protein [Armatimonadetes bacterium]|nr:ABC transporter ATP-binding protein [Armatimonadota bacterium]